MAESPDFKELLRAFNERKAEYLIVGGYAVMKYTEPRFTKYLDSRSPLRPAAFLLMIRSRSEMK